MTTARMNNASHVILYGELLKIYLKLVKPAQYQKIIA